MIYFKGTFNLPDNRNLSIAHESGFILLMPQLKHDRMDIDCLVYLSLGAIQIPNGHIANFRINDLMYDRYIAYKGKKRIPLNFHKQSFTNGKITRVCIDDKDGEHFYFIKNDQYFSVENEKITLKKESVISADNNGKNVIEKTLMQAHKLLMERFEKIYETEIAEKTISFQIEKVPLK